MSSSNMPTGASGFMPRRSSYASVVSGVATGSPHSYSQVMRSGAFAHLAHSEAEPGYDYTSYHNLGGHSRHDSRAYDMDYTTNGGTHGRSGSWSRGGQLPSFSSAFGPLINGYGHGGFGGGHTDHFFTPSYLKGSKYVQKLEDAHRAKLAAHKEGHSTQSSQPGSLSTSASSINLHTKIAPSHRGMTYDLIEKAPLVDDEILAPLPSRWNSQDKYGGLEVLSDGQEVKFTGAKSERDRDLEACAIRADHPMPPQCGIYYFEVTIISRKREESSIGIGFSSKNVPLSRLPGWEPESWAYHGDDGHSFCCNSSGKHYGPSFNAGDIVGCGINFRSNSAFFTKNGVHLGTAFRDINKEKLYPSVGMKKSGEHVRVNFGQSPFVFDIDAVNSPGWTEHFRIFQAIKTTKEHGPKTAPMASTQPLDDDTDSDNEMPPLITPPTPRSPSPARSTASQEDTSSAETAMASPQPQTVPEDHQPQLARDDSMAPSHVDPWNVAFSPSRSMRTSVLLSRLEAQSRIRPLRSIEQQMIRIAEGIEEHRNEMIISTAAGRTSGNHEDWRRIAGSERALDDLGDRISIELFTTLSTAGPRLTGGANTSLDELEASALRGARGEETAGAAAQSVRERAPINRSRGLGSAIDRYRALGTGPPGFSQLSASNGSALPGNNGNRLLPQFNGAGAPGMNGILLPPRPLIGGPWLADTGNILITPIPLVRPGSQGNTAMIPPPSPLNRLRGRIEADRLRFDQMMTRDSLSRPKNFYTMTDFEKQQERNQIRSQIEVTSTAKLAPPLSETDLIQSLVLQFLSHDGYVETARAFAEEIHEEKKALNLDPNAVVEGVDVKEDEDASHRQRIRKAVLEGDVEKAFKYTQAYYPSVLKDNEHVSFRLKCRRFIEMIRQGAEMQNSSNSNGVKKSNGHNGDWYDEVAQGMDLDDHQSQANNWDRMDTEETSENQMEYQNLLQETLAYGQALQAEYKDDPRREIGKALEEAFALMAYTDPLNAKEVAHLLDPSGRAAVAEELNSAILLSLGKSSTAALEKVIQQSTVLLEELGEAGGPGAFVSIDDYVKVRPS